MKKIVSLAIVALLLMSVMIVPSFAESKEIAISEVTAQGFLNFGPINAPENVLDGNQDTVTGSGFNADVEQSVTLQFSAATNVKSVFIQCKDEGNTTNDDGTRGTYDIYAIVGGNATKIASDVPAVTGTDGGKTVELSTPVKADAIKVVITSWQGDCWACVADLKVQDANGWISSGVATGDSTVVFAVVAVVALLGMGVVVTKKVTVR